MRGLSMFVREGAVMLGFFGVLFRLWMTSMVMMVRSLAVMMSSGCVMRGGEMMLFARQMFLHSHDCLHCWIF